MDPTPAELRVLGCLIEKQRTTPDQYPLTLNALRLACNQSTNRDPVLDLDEHTVREAAQALGRRRWARLASGQGSRAPKYRHLLDEALGIGSDELAVLAVLLLRGPQTPGELKQRTERLHRFADLDEVQFTVEKLIGRGHVARLGRRPGQKEERFAHLLGGDEPAVGAPPPPSAPPGVPPAPMWSESPEEPHVVAAAAPSSAPEDTRLAALEEEVRALRTELDDLRGELRALRDELGA